MSSSYSSWFCRLCIFTTLDTPSFLHFPYITWIWIFITLFTFYSKYMGHDFYNNLWSTIMEITAHTLLNEFVPSVHKVISPLKCMDSSSSTGMSVYVLLINQSNATRCLQYYNLDESSLVTLESGWQTSQAKIYSHGNSIHHPLPSYCIKMYRVCHYNSLGNEINAINIRPSKLYCLFPVPLFSKNRGRQGRWLLIIYYAKCVYIEQ